MTKFVQQREPSDCVVCCLAMHTGKSYEYVLSVVGDLYKPGTGLRDEGEALRKLGFKSEYENGHAIGDFVNLYRGFYISAEYFRSQAWGRRALLSVPSLNIEAGWHMVYYDGKTVHDPNRGVEGKAHYQTFTELKPDYITLFDEHREAE